MIRTSTVVRSLAISAVLALVVTLIVAGSVGAQGNLQHPPDPGFQGETGVWRASATTT